MGADIFISYSHEDNKQATLIADTLEKSGASVWFDKTNLRAGQAFASRLYRGVDDCKVFILIVSQTTASSPWVQNELTIATNKRKPILPIFIEDAELDEELGFFLVRFHHLYLTEVTPEAIRDQVIPALESLGIEVDPEPLPPPPPRPSIGLPHAVVVGISRYEDPGIPDLKYAAKDADQIAKTLIERAGYPADHVSLLTDEKATLSQIKIAIAGMRSVEENNLVLFYFAGHGRADINPPVADRRDKLVWKYLVTHDARGEHLDLTALSLDDLQANFARLPSKHQVYLLDSCYSGEGRSLVTPNSTRGELSDPDWGDMTGGERVVLAACQATEMAYEYDDAGNGLFTHFLVRGLEGEAANPDDGVVYVDSLYDYLLGEIPPVAERALNGRQHPAIYGQARTPLPLTFGKPISAPEADPLQEAKALYNAGDCEKSIQFLNQFLPVAGERAAEAYCLLGKNYQKTDSLDFALSAFESAIQNGERDLQTLPEAYLGKGEVFKEKENFGEAIEAYRTAALLNEEYEKQYPLLRLALERAIRTEPSAAVNYLHLARIMRLQGLHGHSTPVALKGIEKWLVGNLDELEEHLRNGEALFSLWESSEIRATFEQRLKDYNDFLSHLNRGKDALAAGDLLLSREELERCLALQPDAQELAELIREIDQRQEACKSHLELTREKIDAGIVEEAQLLLEKAQNLDSSHPAIDELQRELEQARELDSHIKGLLEQAAAYERDYRLGEAISALNQVFRLSSGRVDIGKRLEQIKAKQQKRNLARQLMQKAATLEAQNQLREALSALKQAAILAPELGEIKQQQASVEARLKDENFEHLKKNESLLSQLVRPALQEREVLLVKEALDRAALLPIDLDRVEELLRGEYSKRLQREVEQHLQKATALIKIALERPDAGNLAPAQAEIERIEALKPGTLLQPTLRNRLGEVKKRIEAWIPFQNELRRGRSALAENDVLGAFFHLSKIVLTATDEEVLAYIRKELGPLERRVRKKEIEAARALPDDMVLVPSGFYSMGRADTSGWAFLDAYAIDRFPVTNRQYGQFLESLKKNGKKIHDFSTGEEPRPKDPTPMGWQEGEFPEDDAPVVGVDWFDAFAYARWAGKELPSEPQWEKAALWDDEHKRLQRYPWGGTFDVPCNTAEAGIGKPSLVGRYPESKSYYQVHDMYGNVWEWCNDGYTLAFPPETIDSSLFSMGDILNWSGLCSKMNGDAHEDSPNPGKRIWHQLPKKIQSLIEVPTAETDLSAEDRSDIIAALNHLLEKRDLYQRRDFAQITLPAAARELLSQNQKEFSTSKIQKLNRLLIEAAYPHEIARNQEERNPCGPTFGEARVLRGGSWQEGEAEIEPQYRTRAFPLVRAPYIGFRCVQSMALDFS